MTPQPSNIQPTEDEMDKALLIFQDYTASWGYPMNQEAHAKGLAIVKTALQRLQNAEYQRGYDDCLKEHGAIFADPLTEMFEANGIKVVDATPRKEK